jgi:hypothetical protein
MKALKGMIGKIEERLKWINHNRPQFCIIITCMFVFSPIHFIPPNIYFSVCFYQPQTCSWKLVTNFKSYNFMKNDYTCILYIYTTATLWKTWKLIIYLVVGHLVSNILLHIKWIIIYNVWIIFCKMNNL